MITKLGCFFEHCNGLIFHFNTHCYLFLACFSIGITYIPVQKLFFLILTHNPKKLCRKRVDTGTKIPKLLKLSSNQKMAQVGEIISPL